MMNIRFIAERAAEVSRRLAIFSTEAKNEILQKIAGQLEERTPEILKANSRDVREAVKKKLPAALLDRLALSRQRMENSAGEVRMVASLKDYAGEIIEARELPSGLYLKRVRVPLGVILMIYEARPHVTIDAAVLALKSGNAIILKCGSDAMYSAQAIVKVIQDVLREVSFLEPQARLHDAVQLIDGGDRNGLKKLMHMHDLIDVVIPRGGKGLIDFIRTNSRVPVIETGASVVHTYLHEDADMAKAVAIVLNAKLRRVSICNALDTVLVHTAIAEKFLRAFAAALPSNKYKAGRLEIRSDSAAYKILSRQKPAPTFSLILRKAKPADYSTEFLDYILAVKTVNSFEEAVRHINRYSLKHSEAIVTEDRITAERFMQTVDAACVYWNASTQFSDGAQFGLGAEIGISTQKMHVRGPFALEGLTSYKWLIEGSGQIRKN